MYNTMYRFQCVLIQCANKSTNKDEMRRRPAQMSKLLESESVLITITLFYKCFLKPSATELHLCLKTQISSFCFGPCPFNICGASIFEMPLQCLHLFCAKGRHESEKGSHHAAQNQSAHKAVTSQDAQVHGHI